MSKHTNSKNDNKRCSGCKLVLDALAFYKNQRWCKECCGEYVKKNKAKLKTYYANWAKKNRVHDREWYKNWIEKNNERYLELQRLGQKRYNKRYPEKINAQRKLNNAVRLRKITRLACGVCGNILSEAHHPDYSKPLDVWWLCKKHHRLADKGKLKLYA